MYESMLNKLDGVGKMLYEIADTTPKDKKFVKTVVSKLSKRTGISKRKLVNLLLMDRIFEEHAIHEEVRRRVEAMTTKQIQDELEEIKRLKKGEK
jgi:hypothetical protein